MKIQFGNLKVFIDYSEKYTQAYASDMENLYYQEGQVSDISFDYDAEKTYIVETLSASGSGS